MPKLTRRHLLIAGLLVALVVAVAVVLFTRSEGLKTRLARISIGMPREQVEEILGPPRLDMNRTGGRGELLVWVDQLWQVDVYTGPDGRVQSTGIKPSDSATRQAEAWFNSVRK